MYSCYYTASDDSCGMKTGNDRGTCTGWPAHWACANHSPTTC